MKAISRIRNYIRFRINRWRYDFQNKVDGNKLNFRQINSIVISKIDGKLGDTEVISPFIAALKRSCPHLQITVLTSATLAPLYRDFMKVAVIVLPKRPTRKQLQQVSKQVGKCDLFLTLEEYFRFQDFYLLYLLKPYFVAGVCPEVKAINIRLDYKNCHITEYFSALLSLGGIQDPCLEYLPFVSKEHLSKVKSFCQQHQIMLCPWGASKHKHLSDETIVNVAKAILGSTSLPLALMVPPDGAYLHQLLKDRVDDPSRLVKIPKNLHLLDLPAICAQSCAVISVDTAYVHLACAAKIPLFAIYNGNNPRLQTMWSPLPNKKDAVIFSVPNRMIDDLVFADIAKSLDSFFNALKEAGFPVLTSLIISK